jgi:hypothetical protein
MLNSFAGHPTTNYITTDAMRICVSMPKIEPPRIDTFEFPPLALPLSIFTTVSLLPHFADSFPRSSYLAVPLFVAREYIGAKPFAFGVWFTTFCHVLQSSYTASLCWRHSTPFFVGVRSTLLFYSEHVFLPFLRGRGGYQCL